MSKKNKQQKRDQARPALRETAAMAGGSIAASSPSAAAFIDEGPEPTAGEAALPVLLIALLALLIFLADTLMSNRGGGFDPNVYYPYFNFAAVNDAHPQTEEQKLSRKGKQTFDFVCAACHQSTGLGIAGQFPPLAGSDWVLGEGPNRIIRIVLNGVQGPIEVKGQAFNNAMPAQKDVLKDDQIAAVLTYIRNQWGNKGPAVTEEQVKKVREAEKARDSAFSPDELKKISEKD